MMRTFLLVLSLMAMGSLGACDDESSSNNQSNNVNNVNNLNNVNNINNINNVNNINNINNINNTNNINNANNQNPVYVGTSDVFAPGPLAVQFLEVEAGEPGPPVLVRVWYPQQAGTYAIVIFQHGFLMNSGWYSGMLEHLASHGFVVAAPQMYAADGLPLGKPTAAEEAVTAAAVHSWVTTQLATQLGTTVPFAQRLGYAGHSRGGKVSWLVLDANPALAQAVAGVDPVDGTGGPMGGEARVIDGPFGFPFPSYVLGTGLGSQSSGFNQPCAPTGDNHVEFYGASAAPAWHVVATEYGHNDLLDEDASCGMTCTVCAGGPTPALFLQLVSGHLTAFFRGALQQDAGAFATLSNTGAAPVTVTVESR
jgi:chlorophyllase